MTHPLPSREALRVTEEGLRLDGAPLAALAEAHGTPSWAYGADTLRRRARRLLCALEAVGRPVAAHYAMKANGALAVLRLLAAEGLGVDVVSGGELQRAEAAGIAAGRMVFSGVGKTEEELLLALDRGLGQFNVESAAELETLSALAARTGLTARVALRVNPDVDAGTHAKITTGLAGNKFGIPLAEAPMLYRRAASLPGIELRGLATHIGSQITDMAPFRAAYAVLADLTRGLRAEGLPVHALDCGGGLGIGYRGEADAAPEAFAAVLRETLGGLDCDLAIEPGRWLVGPAGVLLARVVLEKQAAGRRFVVLDAGMNDLARPAMYEAWHDILPVRPRPGPMTPADVVGPVCETGDTFARDRLLPPLESGDLVAILDAGAYGGVMSSTYNARPLAAEAMASDGAWDLIRPRQAVEALWAGERLPSWL